MNQQRILLKLLFDEIGLKDLSLDTFQQRLLLQKKIYLTQIAGLDLGYRYNWYLRGPYCPSLTEMAFLLRDEISNGEDDYTEYCLGNKALSAVKEANQIWETPPGIEEVDWLEALASIHYLKNIAYWPQKPPRKEDVLNHLLKAKPRFQDKREILDQAWLHLRDKSLLGILASDDN